MPFPRLFRSVREPVRTRYQALASKNDLDILYSQIAGLLDVRDAVGPNVRIGQLRGWAISPDALAEVLHAVQLRKNPRVVEFGSGNSTVAIAAALRRQGGGSLLSFEHDAEFGKKTLARVEALGLSDFVDMRCVETAEFKDAGGSAFRSYTLPEEDIRFDVALVDGPIRRAHGAACRLVPMEWCFKRAKPGAVVFLDDADRVGEQEIVEGLKARYPNASFEHIQTEKGLVRAVFQGS